MNIQELTTWNRLHNLAFDVADAALPFSARLARDNGWSRELASRAIEEYRRFCFLTAHAGHPVTPSDEVDQVWHLHLTYSRHYWETLCRDVLERPLHHGPTKGGGDEDRKFHDWYEATLASYRRHFGEPPKDLWPDAVERFHERNDFVRINRRDVVAIDRASLKRAAIATVAGGGVLAVAQAIAQVDGAAASRPTGAWLVVLAVIGVIVAIYAGSRRNRRSGPASVKPARKPGKANAGAFVGGAGCGSSSGKGSGDGNGADGASSGCGGSGGGSAGCGGGGCGGGG